MLITSFFWHYNLVARRGEVDALKVSKRWLWDEMPQWVPMCLYQKLHSSHAWWESSKSTDRQSISSCLLMLKAKFFHTPLWRAGQILCTWKPWWIQLKSRVFSPNTTMPLHLLLLLLFLGSLCIMGAAFVHTEAPKTAKGTSVGAASCTWQVLPCKVTCLNLFFKSQRSLLFKVSCILGSLMLCGVPQVRPHVGPIVVSVSWNYRNLLQFFWIFLFVWFC